MEIKYYRKTISNIKLLETKYGHRAQRDIAKRFYHSTLPTTVKGWKNREKCEFIAGWHNRSLGRLDIRQVLDWNEFLHASPEKAYGGFSKL